MANYLRYSNQGATRNQPLSKQLERALRYLDTMGVTAEVFSGGQPGKGSGLARVGSVRHDHGNAADVRFYKGDERLNWANPGHVPIFQEIVRKGKAQGLTGFGAGPGYMEPGTMHVGFGSPGVWGAGGKGATAPGWLRAAYGGGNDSVVGGGGTDPIAEPANPYASPPGLLGGDSMVARNFDPQIAAAGGSSSKGLLSQDNGLLPEMAGDVPGFVSGLAKKDDEEPGLFERLSYALRQVPNAPTGHTGGFRDAREGADALLKMLSGPPPSQMITQKRHKRRSGQRG